jgi:hypothetical protein
MRVAFAKRGSNRALSVYQTDRECPDDHDVDLSPNFKSYPARFTGSLMIW